MYRGHTGFEPVPRKPQKMSSPRGPLERKHPDLQRAHGNLDVKDVIQARFGGEHHVKTLLRKTQARTVEALWTTIGALLDQFSSGECKNYIRHCGYCQSG